MSQKPIEISKIGNKLDRGRFLWGLAKKFVNFGQLTKKL